MNNREKKKEEKRNKMLETAMEEFAVKSYSDVSTDVITMRCGISKGLLFHYFTSKKNLYLACLENALKQTTYAPVKTPPVDTGTGREAFYALLWAQFKARAELEQSFPLEKTFIDMASKEEAEEVKKEKKELMDKFLHLKEILAARGMADAMEHLALKEPDNPKVKQGMTLYIHSVWEYLLKAENGMDEAMQKQEMEALLEPMLNGICRE